MTKYQQQKELDRIAVWMGNHFPVQYGMFVLLIGGFEPVKFSHN